MVRRVDSSLLESIKSTLCHCFCFPFYFLSYFKFSSWVKLRIDKIRLRFLWHGAYLLSKAYPLVRWRQACQYKLEGVLGVLCLWDINKALLTKWWWSLLSRPIVMASNIFCQKYEPRLVIQNAKLKNTSKLSSLWRGVQMVRELFLFDISFTLRDGSSINFQRIFWCENTSLQYLLFRI